MNIRNKITEFNKAKLQLEKFEAALSKELNDKVFSAAEICLKKSRELEEAKGNHCGYGWPSSNALSPYDKWTIQDDEIVVEWEETWNYGGHDQGSFSMKLDFVLNENNEQSNYIVEMNNQIKKSKQEKEQKEKEIKIKKLNQLKAELS
ncbi:MAG: hypothetical protein DWQ19_09530 [Crenarchaeota archaeon]|nr:MAG: hypothetical protein DWQ19_09530 [Thermoproteota archaeon]